MNKPQVKSPRFQAPKARIEIVFLILILIVLSIYLYWNTISLFPSYIHAWTQSDRYAIALGFIENGFDFFHPQTMNLETKGGITNVDFPIHEYLVAILMKTTAIKEPIVFRLYSLFYGFAGLIFLFLTVKLFSSSNLKAAFVALFAFTAPVYAYYQAGFLPTIPCLANAIIGYYFFFKYLKTAKLKDFYLSLFFLTLSALSRTTFVIFLIASLFQYLMAFFSIKKINYKIITAYFGSAAIITGYYLYNLYLTKVYGSRFLGNFMPPDNFHNLTDILNTAYHNWSMHYFTVYHYLTIIVCLAFVIYKNVKKRTSDLFETKVVFQISLMFFGAASAFFLLAKQFVDHDYYFLDTFFIVVVIFLAYSMSYIPANTKFQKTGFFTAALAISLFMAVKCKAVQAIRYTSGYWDRVELTRENFTGSDELLNSLGIPLSAKILVLDAYSTNAPLILMNRKGFTVLTTSETKIRQALNWDYDFIVIQDQFLVSDVIANYPKIMNMIYKIGSNGKITVYKRGAKRNKLDLHAFLNIDRNNILYQEFVNFDHDLSYPNWINTDTKTTREFYTNDQSAFMDSSMEFGATFQIKTNKQGLSSAGYLLFESKILAPQKLNKTEIVLSITNGTEQISYTAFDLNLYVKQSDDWQKLQFLFPLNLRKNADDLIKLYLWNPGKSMFFYDDILVVIY